MSERSTHTCLHIQTNRLSEFRTSSSSFTGTATWKVSEELLADVPPGAAARAFISFRNRYATRERRTEARQRGEGVRLPMGVTQENHQGTGTAASNSRQTSTPRNTCIQCREPRFLAQQLFNWYHASTGCVWLSHLLDKCSNSYDCHEFRVSNCLCHIVDIGNLLSGSIPPSYTAFFLIAISKVSAFSLFVSLCSTLPRRWGIGEQLRLVLCCEFQGYVGQNKTAW